MKNLLLNILKFILGFILIVVILCLFFLVMGAIAVVLLEVGVKRFLIFGGLGFIILIAIMIKFISSRN